MQTVSHYKKSESPGKNKNKRIVCYGSTNKENFGMSLAVSIFPFNNSGILIKFDGGVRNRLKKHNRQY